MINKYYTEYKIKSIDRAITFILIAMIGIIPIITSRYSGTTYSPVYLNNIYGTGYKSDLFNLYKTIAIYIGSISVFILFIYRLFKLNTDIKSSKLNLAIIALVLSILVSTLFTNYKDIALFGNSDRHEGALAWLCQIAIFFVLCNITIENKYYKYFYFALYPFLIINTITSISTVVYGKHLLSNKFVQFIVGGDGKIAGDIYTTLYNPNFGSGVAGLIFCVSLMYLLLETDLKKKILILIGTILSFTTTICLVSNSGFLTILLLIPIIIVIGLRFRNKKDVVIWTLITFAINFLILIMLSSKNERIYNESIGFIEKINSVSNYIIPCILVVFLLILLILKFVDKKRFFKMSIIIVSFIAIISVAFYSYNLNKEKVMLEKNPNKNIVRMQDSQVFKQLNKMSTGRIYIWNKVIEKINDKPIVGYGLDTFPYEFIPNDKNNGELTESSVIDKPHNLYLSIAYGSGVIALVGFIFLIGSIIKESFYKCIDKIDNKYIYIYVIGVIGYAIQGIFNDSFPGTLLIFWIMAGLSVNLLYLKNKEI